jgi:hypothetical protein
MKLFRVMSGAPVVDDTALEEDAFEGSLAAFPWASLKVTLGRWGVLGGVGMVVVSGEASGLLDDPASTPSGDCEGSGSPSILITAAAFRAMYSIISIVTRRPTRWTRRMSCVDIGRRDAGCLLSKGTGRARGGGGAGGFDMEGGSSAGAESGVEAIKGEHVQPVDLGV